MHNILVCCTEFYFFGGHYLLDGQHVFQENDFPVKRPSKALASWLIARIEMCEIRQIDMCDWAQNVTRWFQAIYNVFLTISWVNSWFCQRSVAFRNEQTVLPDDKVTHTWKRKHEKESQWGEGSLLSSQRTVILWNSCTVQCLLRPLHVILTTQQKAGLLSNHV